MRWMMHFCFFVTVGNALLCSAMAQTKSVAVNLHIILHPILELTIDPNQLSASLIYNNAADYKNGVELVNKEFIKISSTVPYVVSIQLVNDGFKVIEGDPQKNLTTDVVEVVANSNEPDNGIQFESPQLSAENRTLFSGTKIAFNKFFDISYKGPGNNFFVDYLSKSGSTAFAGTLIYSIVPQ